MTLSPPEDAPAQSALVLPSGDGQIPGTPGIENLPLLSASSKVQEWLTSSISDHVGSYDHGQHSSGMTAAAADSACATEGIGRASQSSAEVSQCGQVKRGTWINAHAPQSSPVDAPLSVVCLGPPPQPPRHDRAFPPAKASSSSESDERGSSRLVSILGSEIGAVADVMEGGDSAAPACTEHSAVQRSSLLQPPGRTSTSARINAASGIGNVLTLLKNRSTVNGVSSQPDAGPPGVMQDVSAAVASLHNPGAASGPSVTGSVESAPASDAAAAQQGRGGEPGSRFSPGGQHQPLQPTPGGIVSMLDMQQQVAEMFLGPSKQRGSGGKHAADLLRADPQGGWSPPSLAANEADATSSSSSTSLVTPLRVHADAAVQPYVGAPLPSTECDRMGHLCSLNVLGTTPERRFDRVTGLAATVRPSFPHPALTPACSFQPGPVLVALLLSPR